MSVNRFCSTTTGSLSLRRRLSYRLATAPSKKWNQLSARPIRSTNSRRKEEAVKAEQLKKTFGGDVEFVLFLCGYFDSAYLGYEAAEGIDWIWEHRIADLEKAGV